MNARSHALAPWLAHAFKFDSCTSSCLRRVLRKYCCVTLRLTCWELHLYNCPVSSFLSSMHIRSEFVLSCTWTRWLSLLVPLTCRMVPHKTARGAAALERMKVFEGVPAPYDKVKRMVVPDALQPLRLQKGHKFCQLGDLSTSVSCCGRRGDSNIIWQIGCFKSSKPAANLNVLASMCANTHTHTRTHTHARTLHACAH